MPVENADDKCARFVRLLATCQRRLFLFALSLLHDFNEAEEVVQSASVVLWKKFDEFTPGTDFAKWASRVVYFEVLKRREEQANRLLPLRPEVLETLAEEATGLLDEADRRREALERCLARLRTRDRRLVIERYRDGNDTATLARRHGRSVEAVRRALHRLRMALLACIRRELALGEHP